MTIYNFSAGPAMLPHSVKEQIEADLYNWNNTGCSVMEMSHRSPEFTAMADENEVLLREILSIPEDYAVMLIPGGARLQYSMLPLNISSAQARAVYAINGHWGKEALKEAKRFCDAVPTHEISETSVKSVPTLSSSTVPMKGDYFHYTSNETLEGLQWHKIPDAQGVRMCCDMTSDLLTRPVPIDKYSMIYASAQKNMGIAGITCVIMRKTDIGISQNNLPTMLNYQTYEKTRSFYNTPPVFPWYVMLLMLRWVKKNGGLIQMQANNQKKSSALYDYVDSSGFFNNGIDTDSRSEINVPFWLADESLNTRFLEQSSNAGLKALKGHMAVGGMRASIYNAMPFDGIESLIAFMREFERVNG